MDSPRQIPVLLPIVLVLAVLLALGGPANVLLNVPPSPYRDNGLGVGTATAVCAVLTLGYALWLRQRWARSALALTLCLMGAFVLGITGETSARDAAPAYLLIEKVRGFAWLVLALTLFASERVDDFLASGASEASADSPSATKREAPRRRDGWLVAGTVLCWFSFLAATHSVLFDASYFAKEGRLLLPSSVPPLVSVGTGVLAVVLMLLAALAFMRAPSRLRYACLIAPLLSPLAGLGGLAINALILVITAFNWRKLRGERAATAD